MSIKCNNDLNTVSQTKGPKQSLVSTFDKISFIRECVTQESVGSFVNEHLFQAGDIRTCLEMQLHSTGVARCILGFLAGIYAQESIPMKNFKLGKNYHNARKAASKVEENPLPLDQFKKVMGFVFHGSNVSRGMGNDLQPGWLTNELKSRDTYRVHSGLDVIPTCAAPGNAVVIRYDIQRFFKTEMELNQLAHEYLVLDLLNCEINVVHTMEEDFFSNPNELPMLHLDIDEDVDFGELDMLDLTDDCSFRSCSEEILAF